mgnify:CR=1 FL=1
MPMVEEFELLEEAEVQFEDSDCAESVWHGVGYCESLFCRKKPAAELTLVIRKEGILYFLCADLPEFQELCRLHDGMSCRITRSAIRWKSGCASWKPEACRVVLVGTFKRAQRCVP